MAYYTLTDQGKAWFAGKAKASLPDAKVLKVLAGMIAENNVPRTETQVARELGLQPKSAEQALSRLMTAGYVVIGHLPQPKEKLETAKPRIRTIEDIVKSEIRAQEARKRYEGSLKGAEAHIRYELGDKGTRKNKKYWRGRGKLVQKAFRIRRNIKSMTAAGIDPKLIAIEAKKLADVEAQLAKRED